MPLILSRVEFMPPETPWMVGGLYLFLLLSLIAMAVLVMRG